MSGHVIGFLVLCAASSAATKPAATVEGVYPGLATGALTQARLADLPEGVWVKAPGVSLGKADVEKELAGADETVRPQFEAQTFFIAEHLAARRLLLAEAKAAAPTATRPAAQAEDDLLDALLRPIAQKVKVDDAEVKAFYDRNAKMFGGAALKDVKTEIEIYLRDEKANAAVQGYVRDLGRRMDIQVSAAWAKAQFAVARDNEVDKARWSGKRPTLVAFGCARCCGPDETQPLMGAVAERLKDQANVLYVDGQRDAVLAARYGAATWPTFIFFDAQGREIDRRTGAQEEEDLVALATKAAGK